MTTTLNRTSTSRRKDRFEAMFGVVAFCSLVVLNTSGRAAEGEAFLCVTNPQTGWLNSLCCAGDTNRVEFLRSGQALGAVRLRVRTPGVPWREVWQSTNGTELTSYGQKTHAAAR
jgi:hypothetical protein